MLSPNKNKSLYGGDTLLRSVSLADDTLKIVNRDPEKRKALQQVRRENLNTAIKLKKEAEDFYTGLEKDKNFKPTTDYQKALFSTALKQQKWENDAEQARVRSQQEHSTNLVRDSATVNTGWWGVLNLFDGLFNSNMRDNRKTYTDSNGKEGLMTIEGSQYYKTIDGKKTLATQKDIEDSGIHGRFNEVSSNMNASTAYYLGHKTDQAINNAAHYFTTKAVSASAATARLVGSNTKTLGRLISGDYKSKSEIWDEWSGVNSNAIKAIYYSVNSGAYGIEEMIAKSLGDEEWQKNVAGYKANNDLWSEQAGKAQEEWYKKATERTKKSKAKGIVGVFDAIESSAQDKSNELRDFHTNYSNLESALQTRAIELGNRTQQTFSQKNQTVSKSMYTDPVSGKQYPLEKVDDPSKEAGGKASAFDVKDLVRNEDKTVRLDSKGVPVYKDKFSKWEAFKSSNSGAVFDKYFFGDVVLTEGIEALGDIASMILLEKGMGAASKGVNMLGKGVKTLDKAVGLNANKFLINQSDKLASKIAGTAERALDSKLGRFAESTVGGKKITAKFAPTLKDGVQSLKGVSNEKIKQFSKNMTIAYLEGNDESDEIGNDVRNKIMEEKVDKLSGIDTDKIAQRMMGESPALDSAQAYFKAGLEANKQRSEWLEANPDAASEVLAFAQLGQEVARATNNLGFITNLGQVSAVLKNKTLSRTLRNNPYDAINPLSLIKDLGKGGMAAGGILKKTYNKEFGAAIKQTMQTIGSVGKKTLGNEAIKQGFIEGVLEEGFLNTSAERAGLAAGRGQAYNLLDIFDNLDSELAESMYAGFIIGAGQSKASSVASGFNGGYKAFKDQQKQVKSIMSRTPSTKEEINKFFETTLSSTNLNETLDKIEELNSPYIFETDAESGSSTRRRKNKVELKEDSEKIEELQKDNFIAHMLAAASQGNSDAFDKVIDKAFEQEGLEPDDLIQLQEAKNLNKFISSTFDRFASLSGYDATALTLNRVQRMLLEDTLKEVESYKTGLDNALNERKDTRLMEEAEDMTQYTGRTSEVFDILTEHGNDHADLSTVADIELKTLAQNRNNVEAQVKKAMQTLDNTYDKLLEGGNIAFNSGKSLTYYQQQAVKKAVAQTQSLTELETLIQSNKELALDERKDILAKREQLNKEAFVDSAVKVPTAEEVESNEKPEVSEAKRQVAEGLDREVEADNELKYQELRSSRRRKANKSTRISRQKNNNLATPKVKKVKTVEEPDTIKPPVKEKKTVQSTDDDGEITELIDEALDIIDEINEEIEASGTGAMIEGYRLGDSLSVDDAVADKDIIEQLFRGGNIPIIENLERSGDGKLIGTIRYSDDPEDVINIELVEKEVLPTQKTSGDYKSYKIGQPIPQSSILEWTDGRTKMAKNYLKYGNPKITKLPDDKGNATVKFDGGPSAKIRLRRQTVEEIQVEDINEKLAKAAESMFGIPVGDKARVGNIIDGPVPSGLTNNSVVEIVTYFGPTDDVLVLSENGNTYYIPMKLDSAAANLINEEETWLDFSQREPTLMDDLDSAIKDIFRANPEITAEDLLSLLEQNNIVEKNC